MKREYWFSLMLAFILLIGLMTYDFYLTHKLIKQTKTEIVEIHDTIVKTHTDSFFIQSPIVYKVDTLKVHTEQVWSPQIHDTVQVELPYIQKEYRDSTYEAYVSGYKDVNLDSIRVFQHNKIVQINNNIERIKYKNRPFGISIGLGGTYSPVSNKIEPGVFLGITYTIKSFGK